MITRDQVLTNEIVLGTIRGLDEIFSKFDLQSLLFNPKKKAYQVSDKVVVQIDTDKVFVDWKQNRYLYVLAVTYSGICVDVDILFDKDGNILESAKNKAFPGDWNEVEGCAFCCETNAVLTSSMKNGNDTIYSTIRMDVRPEDDLYQLDTEMAYQIGDSQQMTAEWSNDAIDINYCPICGRRLRQGKPMLYRGINVNYNNTEASINEPEKIVKMRDRIISYQNENEYLSKSNPIDEKEIKDIIQDKSEPIKDRIYSKIDFILKNITMVENPIIRMGVLNDLEYVINNSLVWDEYTEGQLVIIIEDKLLSNNKEEK